MVDYIVYIIVRLFVAMAQALPLSVSMAIVHTLAFVFHYVIRLRRKLIEENIRCAFPNMTEREVQHTAHRMWIHLFTLALEVAIINRKIHETTWKEHFHLHGVNRFIHTVLMGRPFAVITAHYGNFEAAGYALGLLGFPSYAIARTLDNPYLNRFVNTFRSSTGEYIVPRDKAPDILPGVVKRCGTIGFLSDQFAGPRGVWVKCLNRETSCPKGVAVFAMADNVPCCVGFGRRINGVPLQFDLWLASYLDPLENTEVSQSVQSITEWYNHEFEKMIIDDPAQYWWIHRKWRPRVKKVGNRQ
ncbi:MAG: lysophospholipid acyltransferase family protein [Thermoguttaceae bacterium]|nr:lysophospholipid acyltransferase family protein [Thermoguttaceae bacterium]